MKEGVGAREESEAVIISGFDMPGKTGRLPEWEELLSSAARLQQILPEAVLVGGTAAAIHAEHRFSLDADHVLTDLRVRFDAVLQQLESVALATHLGADSTGEALRSFDRRYPQESGESALQQLQAQLANPLPYDLDELDLSEYRDLAPQWQDWGRVKAACGRMAVAVFDHVCEVE